MLIAFIRRMNQEVLCLRGISDETVMEVFDDFWGM